VDSPSPTSKATSSNPAAPPRPQKPLLSRINESNRTLGIFFGCIGGMILGIILVADHSASIAIIGAPSSPVLKVLTVLLAMGTGGNLCSYIGSCLDLITGERTIFDACLALYLTCTRPPRSEEQDERRH
jgi:hypothetical protein